MVIPYIYIQIYSLLILVNHPRHFRFSVLYRPEDFPLSLKLRQNIYLQGRVQTNDKRLSIIAERCFATPTPNNNDPKKHVILDNG